MTLLAEILALPNAAALIAARDDAAIAAAVSTGRVRPSGREIGKGTILETIGLAAGNAFLDVIDNVADFRHVKGLVAEGRLIVSSPLVIDTIRSFVPAALTQEAANALLALAVTPNPYSVNDVSNVLNAKGY